MAFTPEQEAAILDFVTKSTAAPAAAAAKQEEPATKSIAQQAREEIEAAKSKSIVDQAKDAVAADKAAGESLTKVEESIKFNLSVADFVKKNESILPEESGKILAAISVKTFKDENEKANAARKNLLDSFLSQKENLVVMTSSMQARAEAFKALAESDKERRSPEFWDLVEVGVALKQGARKAEVLNKINGGSAGDSGNILQNKLLAAADKKFNHSK